MYIQQNPALQPTLLMRPPRHYGHFSLVWIKSQSVILTSKEQLSAQIFVGSWHGFYYRFQQVGNWCSVRQAKCFELNFFIEKRSSRWSNQAGKIILTAGHFTCCPALNESAALVTGLMGFHYILT